MLQIMYIFWLLGAKEGSKEAQRRLKGGSKPKKAQRRLKGYTIYYVTRDACYIVNIAGRIE